VTWCSWIITKDRSKNVDPSTWPKVVQFETDPENWLERGPV